MCPCLSDTKELNKNETKNDQNLKKERKQDKKRSLCHTKVWREMGFVVANHMALVKNISS